MVEEKKQEQVIEQPEQTRVEQNAVNTETTEPSSEVQDISKDSENKETEQKEDEDVIDEKELQEIEQSVLNEEQEKFNKIKEDLLAQINERDEQIKALKDEINNLQAMLDKKIEEVVSTIKGEKKGVDLKAIQQQSVEPKSIEEIPDDQLVEMFWQTARLK